MSWSMEVHGLSDPLGASRDALPAAVAHLLSAPVWLPTRHSSMAPDPFGLLLLQTFATSSSTSPAKRRSKAVQRAARRCTTGANYRGHGNSILFQSVTASCCSLYRAASLQRVGL